MPIVNPCVASRIGQRRFVLPCAEFANPANRAKLPFCSACNQFANPKNKAVTVTFNPSRASNRANACARPNALLF